MEKRLRPDQSWNQVIESLIKTKKAWQEHFEVMDSRPNLEELSTQAQQRLKFAIHRAPDFERFILSFLNVWRTSGGLEEMLIEIEEDELDEMIESSLKKGKKHARGKR